MKIPETPPSLKAILKKKTDKISDAIENDSIRNFIEQANKKYYHWEELRYRQLPKGTDPEIIWALMKVFRIQQYKEFRFGDMKFTYNLLDEALRILHHLDQATAGHLQGMTAKLSMEGHEKYIVSSLMEEAIASSQLEGAATTRKVAKRILRLGTSPRNYSEQMIVNGYNTMKEIRKLRDRKLSPELICQIQQCITEDTLENKKHEGAFREDDNILVGDPIDIEKIYHTPPSYKKIPAMIDKLCDFVNNDDMGFVHPIIKGIILHFLLGYIHPFYDGNGRTARSVFYWFVLTHGYWMFEFMAISRIILRSKKKYGLAYLYSETDENDLTYFIRYNLEAIEEALEDTEKYLARKIEEQNQALKLVDGRSDINLRQAEILRGFIKHPNLRVRIQEIMNKFGVVYQTARSDLLHLEDLGHITKKRIGKKYLFQYTGDTNH